MAFTQVGIEAVVRGLADFQSGTQTIRRQMGLTGSAALRATKQSQGLTTSISQTGQSIRNFGNQVLILGFQLTFLASGAMVSVINQAAQFEKEMTKINTLVGVQAEQVGEWSDALLELGPALGQTPRDLAEGLFFVTSAGIRDSAEALDVLENAAKAAAIGMGDVNDVANAVTSAMQAYSEQGLTASDATDILTATVREGKTQAEELAPSIGRVIPLASQMGVSFQEVGAFIATFTRLGVPAAVAVTSLRSALTAILKPSSAAKDALAEYGLTMDNVRQTIDEQGLATALITLSTILGDDDEAFGKIIGSARGLTGVLAVTGGLTQDYQQILENLNNSAGITAEGFETVSKTTAFMADQAKASLQVVAIEFGQVLLPGINAVLEVVRELAIGFSKLADQNPNLVKAIGGLAAFVTVLGPLLIVSGLVISSIGTLITAIGALGAALASLLSLPALIISAFAAVGLAIGGSLVAGFIEARRQSEESAEQFAWRAYFWGENIILSFAEGMASAINAVIGVLIQLGNAIADWLQAFSPPKLLPNIDKWGKATMQAWLDGFLQVDFGVFNTLSDRLEQFIRTLNIDDTRVVPEIQAMRKALLDVVKIFGETGEISDQAIGKVAKSIGKNNAVLTEYVKTFLQLEKATRAVAEAQDELNQINIKYDALLDPIERQLKEIDNIRQDEIDKLRQEELAAIINDPRAPQRVKELAQLELKQIALKKEQRTLEDARDIETAAANEKLLAAQQEQKLLEDRLQALDEIISTQEKENSLVREQIDLLERLAKAAKGAADEFKGFQGGLPGAGGKKDPVTKALTEAERKLAEKLGISVDGEEKASLGSKILFAFNRLKDKILEIFQPTRTELENLGKAWAPLVDFIIDGVFDVDLSRVDPADRKFFTTFGDSMGKGFEDTSVIGRITLVLVGVFTESLQLATEEIDFVSIGKKIVEGIIEGVKEAFKGENFGDAIAQQVTDTLGSLEFTTPLPGFLSALGFGVGIGENLKDQPLPEIPVNPESLAKWNAFQDSFNSFFTEDTGAKITSFFSNFGLSLDDFGIKSDGATSSLGRFIGGGSAGGAPSGLLGVGTVFPSLGVIIQAFITTTMNDLDDALDNTETFITDTLVPAIEDTWDGAMTTIDEAIKGVEEFLSGDWSTTLSTVEEFISQTLSTAFENLRDLLFGDEDSVGTAFLNLMNEVLEPFKEGVQGVINKVQGLINKVNDLWHSIVDRVWKIPDSFKQDSPSEWETAMTDAALATDIAREAIKQLNMVSSSNVTGMASGALMSSNVPLPSGSSTTNTINFGGQNISNGMDLGEFMLLTQQVIRNEL